MTPMYSLLLVLTFLRRRWSCSYTARPPILSAFHVPFVCDVLRISRRPSFCKAGLWELQSGWPLRGLAGAVQSAQGVPVWKVLSLKAAQLSAFRGWSFLVPRWASRWRDAVDRCLIQYCRVHRTK